MDFICCCCYLPNDFSQVSHKVFILASGARIESLVLLLRRRRGRLTLLNQKYCTILPSMKRWNFTLMLIRFRFILSVVTWTTMAALIDQLTAYFVWLLADVMTMSKVLCNSSLINYFRRMCNEDKRKRKDVCSFN